MKRFITGFVVLSALLALTVMGCTDNSTQGGTQSNAPAAAASQDSANDDHMEYTTAEQCFECHGSYAEHAETTAHLGDWNPHDSIHGGYVDCMNCHSFQKLERNYCAYCHDYKPDMEK